MGALKPEPADDSCEPRATDARQRVARNAFIMLGQHAFVAAVTVFVAALVARHLGPEDYGLYEYSFSLVGSFAVLSTFGLRAVMVRTVAQMRGSPTRYLGLMLALRIGLACLIVPVVLAVSYFLHDRPLVLLTIGIAVVTLPLNAFSTVLRDLFQGKERFDVEAFTLVGIRLFTLIGAVGVVLCGGGVVAIVAIYSAGAIVGMIIPYVAVRKSGISLKPRLTVREAKGVLGQGLPFAANAFVALLLWEINPVLLGKMSTLAMVGVYGAGTRLLGPLEMIPDSVATALCPTVAKGWKDKSVDVDSLLRRVFFLLLVVGMPIGIGGFLCAPSIISLIFGPAFADAGSIFTLVVVVLPLEFITIPTIYVLGAIHQQNAALVINACAAVINIGLNIWLIPEYGALGCAWAVFVVAIVSFVLSQAVLAKHFRCWGGRNAYGGLLLANGLLGAVVFAVRQHGALVAIPVGVVVYFVAIVGLKVVKWREVRDLLRGRVRAVQADDTVDTAIESEE